MTNQRNIARLFNAKNTFCEMHSIELIAWKNIYIQFGEVSQRETKFRNAQ